MKIHDDVFPAEMPEDDYATSDTDGELDNELDSELEWDPDWDPEWDSEYGLNFDPQTEPLTDPLEDTDRIQKAIEKVMDDETSTLPLIPIPHVPQTDMQSDELLPEELLPEELLPEELSMDKIPLEGSNDARVHRWFFTFMCMNIPIGGWIYLLYLAFSKKVTDRRDFARAYLFYKLVFLIVSLVILGLLVFIGLGFLDRVLAYMEML